jgi:hypothetical protein
MRWLVLCALAGCFYSAGSYVTPTGTPFGGKHVSLRCLDLAVTMSDDRDGRTPAIAYSFGNSCWHETTVDLASVRAIGRTTDGQEVPLQAFDPRHELRALPLNATWHGHEEISYRADDGTTPPVVCVDVGRVDRSSAPSERWVCLGANVQGAP